jgi:hypothetical protein
MGVVYEVDKREKPALDLAEGLGQGYVEKEVVVRTSEGTEYCAVTYVADPNYVNTSLKPYTWYKRFVVEGAKQHTLPPDYVWSLEAQPAMQDPNICREKTQLAVRC